MRTLTFGAALAPFALMCATIAFAQNGSSPTSTDSRRAEAVDTVLVTGTQPDIDVARAEVDAVPGGAALIDLTALEQRNVGSIADALRYAPGVWSVSDSGTDDVFISSRGSNLDATDYDMNGIKVFQDGLPVTTADGNNHNRVIDPRASRFATIARGANALSYGSSTLGGAVNFVSPTARESEGAGVSMTAGSHGQRLARVSFGRVSDGAFDGLLALEAKRWDGYREHNEQERTGLYANAGWQLDERWSTRFFATWLENDQELPGSLTRAELDADPDAANPAALAGNFQVDVATRRLANLTSLRIDAQRSLDFGLSIEEQSLYHPIVFVEIDFDGPGPAPPTEVFSLLIDTDHRDVGSMLRYRQQTGRHELTLGLNHGENEVEGSHHRNLRGLPHGLTELIANSAETIELFALDRWQMTDATALVFAAQAVTAERNVRTTEIPSGNASNPRDTYRSFNPRFGVVRDLSSMASFYGNVSRLFEPPTNFELENNVLPGDATLSPMRGTVVEIGTRGERDLSGTSAWGWDVSLYHARIDDEILSVDDPDAPGTSLTTNVDDTVHAGLEALVRGSFALRGGRGALEPVLTATLNDFRFDGHSDYGDNDLPAAPAYFVRGELLYRNARGFFVGPTVDRVGKRWADFANSYRIEAHTLLGLRAGWENGKWSAFADLRNLGDERYVASHAVRNIAAAGDDILNPGEPRSTYFGVALKLD